jgi:hypothetical protein
MEPAVISFLSKGVGLHSAFWFLAALLACVPIFGKYVGLDRTHEMNEKLLEPVNKTL